MQDIPAFIPVGGLGKEDAIDLCHKLGADIGLAGELISEDLLCSEQSKRYRDEDAFLNRGRVMTWLPYNIQTINGTKKSANETTGTELGVDFWYSKAKRRKKTLNYGI